MLGKTIQSFKVLDKIKDGSIGTIFRIEDGSGRVLAMKQLSAQNARIGAKRRAFKKEAILTRKLSHTYIIKVFDYYGDDLQPFFTMEYFPSENLRYHIGHNTAFLNKNEFRVLRCVADALVYTHAHGVIHADIKPENILVSSDYDVRLIDFSLAQTGWDRWNFFRRKSMGTPTYMSPEHIKGTTLDERSDVYSFGVMTFELLAKRPPFTGTTQEAVFEGHLRGRIPSLKECVKTASPLLDGFVERCLQKDPKDRFQNMSSLLYEMTRWERQDTAVRLRQVRKPDPT